nr:hypothetical protein [Tanacetum cinerariifolium]
MVNEHLKSIRCDLADETHEPNEPAYKQVYIGVSNVNKLQLPTKGEGWLQIHVTEHDGVVLQFSVTLVAIREKYKQQKVSPFFVLWRRHTILRPTPMQRYSAPRQKVTTVVFRFFSVKVAWVSCTGNGYDKNGTKPEQNRTKPSTKTESVKKSKVNKKSNPTKSKPEKPKTQEKGGRGTKVVIFQSVV